MTPLLLNQPIAAPIERVFALATDLPRAAEHIDGIDTIEMLTPGPVGLGTRWRETRGKMGTEELEITRFVPPQDGSGSASYTSECDSCGCHFTATFRFESTSQGTDTELQMTAQPQTMMAKIMSPLSSLMMGAARKAMEQDLLDLKRVAEADT